VQPYEGKAKRVTATGKDEVAIYYKDDATAFNGQKHELFAGKGALNSQITEGLFKYLEAEGIRTHHLGRIDARTLKARKVEIILLETIVRFKVAGSLQKRTGLEDGTVVDPPVVEFYYKSDALGDPLFNDDHIAMMKLATPQEVATLRSQALAAAIRLKELFRRAKIDLIDLKFEYGRTPKGIVLADEVSPDTCRLRDLDTGEKLDKDNFRLGIGDLLTGYREVLRRLDPVWGR
jgi:phosphoribosylaminoimidazole-succinocarboxamide synthase